MGSKTGIWLPTVALDLSRDNRVSEGDVFPVQSLMMGQKLATGTAENGSIHKVASLSEVETLCGKGSHLWDVMKSYFAYLSTQPVYIGVFVDADSATKYSTTSDIAVVTPEAGVLGIRVNDEKYTVAVTDSDTATTLGDRIVATINSDENPFVVTNTAGSIKFETRNGGLSVGGINVVYSGDNDDVLPSGVTIGTATVVEGAIDPDMDDVLRNIGDVYFPNLYGPYNATADMQKIVDKLDVLGDKYNAADAIYHTMVTGTASALRTKAAELRSIRIAIHNVSSMPQSKNLYIGSVAREIAISVAQDVNQPLHNLPIRGLRTWTGLEWAERNSIAGDGVASVNPETAELEAPVTTYIETDEERRWENIYNLARARRSFRERILSVYGRAVIITRGAATISSDKTVITLDSARVEATSWYGDEVRAGRMQDQTRFNSEVRVTLTDADTINWYLPMTLVVPFVVGDGILSYRQLTEDE